jgi:hypothetical protein
MPMARCKMLILLPAAFSLLSGCTALRSTQGAKPSLEDAIAPLADLPTRAAKAIRPSNDRDWAPDQARLAYADFHGDRVTVHNIRYCTYRSAEDYTVHYYDKTFDLEKIRRLDFIVVPFLETPTLAHLEISFGFDGGDYLGVSVEIRKEKGEQYAPLKGTLRQFELMYVVCDERDMIRVSTEHSWRGVYLYPARMTPPQVRAMFVDVMHRVNDLRQRPEFYNTFTNNCTTNIVAHLNRSRAARVPYDYRVLFPGYFDRLIYDLGLIDTDRSFEETRLRARINRQALLYAQRPDFSTKIRE